MRTSAHRYSTVVGLYDLMDPNPSSACRSMLEEAIDALSRVECKERIMAEADNYWSVQNTSLGTYVAQLCESHSCLEITLSSLPATCARRVINGDI